MIPDEKKEARDRHIVMMRRPIGLMTTTLEVASCGSVI
jgi:hypothetical protein